MAVAALGAGWANTNATGGSNPSHSDTPDAGSDRCLVAMVLSEDATNDDNTLGSLSAGGQAMTKVIEDIRTDANPSSNGIAIFVLNEAGIAAMSGSSFSFGTWGNGTPSDEVRIYTRYFSGVDQTTLTAGSSSGEGSAADTQIASGISYTDGDMGICGGNSGNSGHTGTIDSPYSEDFQDSGTALAAVGGIAALSGTGSTQPTVSFGGTSRKIIAAIVLNAAAASAGVSVDIDLNQDDDYADTNEADQKVRARPGITIRRGNDMSRRNMGSKVSTMTLELNNETGTHDVGATYAAAEQDPIRVVSSSTTLFAGEIRRLLRFPQKERQCVGVDARDLLGRYAGRSGWTTAVRLNGRIDQCMSDVLDAIGFPSGGSRALDQATRSLTTFKLDKDDDPFAVLDKLRATEGPHAQLYLTGGVLTFKDDDARAGDTRSTNIQTTFRGGTTEPIVDALPSPPESGTDRVANYVSFPWRALGATNPSISLVGSSTAEETGGAASPLTVPAISGVRAGDILLLGFQAAGNITSLAASGWTELHNDSTGAGNDSWSAWRRATEADAADDAVITYSGSPGSTGAAMVAYRGVLALGTPYDDETSVVRDNDASPIATGATSVGANRRFVSILMTSDETFTVPTDYTLQASLANAGHTGNVHIADKEVAAAGTETPEWTGLTDATQDSIVFLVALTPNTGSAWSYGGDLVLGNDEVKTIYADLGTYGAINAITPASGTDYTISDGTLASTPALGETSGSRIAITMTAGAGGAAIRGPTDDPTIGLRLRADPLSVLANGDVVGEDSTSQGTYGQRALKGVSVFPDMAESDMQALADDYVTALKDPRQIASFSVAGDRSATAQTAILAREVSDRVRLLISEQSIDITGWIESVTIHIGDKGRHVATYGIRETV